MAAVVVVALLRPPRARPVPARVLAGDAVATSDGLQGTVVRVDGAYALVDADVDGTRGRAWAQCAQLERAGDGAAPRPVPEGHDGAAPAPELPSPTALTDAGGVLVRLGEVVWQARRTVAGGWFVLLLVAVPLAATAESSFTNGGFLIEDGEAITVLEELRDEFRVPVGQVEVVVPGPIDDASARLQSLTPALYAVPHVLAISEPRASTDGQLVAVTIAFSETDDRVIDSYEELLAVLTSSGWSRDDLQLAGTVATFADTTAQTKRDLARAEAIGTPLALIVLLLVFGTVAAALVPIAIGVVSVVLTLALLHLLSLPLGLSIFVMNIASMLGFGLGIDYSLLGVSRFREELDAGRSVRDAVVTTVATSGRAAAVSGVAVIAGVAALAVIPLPVMFAIALGGVVVVAVTVLASLTLLPALLGLLGHRIEFGRVRRRRAAPAPGVDVVAQSAWYRLAHRVMRRPGLSLAIGVGLLLVLASPATTARLDVPHDEVLPVDAPSRIAKRVLAERFDELVESPVVLVVDTADEAQVEAVRAGLLGVPRVRRTVVVAVDADRRRTVVNAYGDAAVSAGGAAARGVVRDIDRLDLPVDVQVSGQGAGEIEFLRVVKEGMPRTLVLMFASTLVVLAVAFRSVTLPVKAVVLDTLSILASLGVVVAVFQWGVGVELLGSEALGYTEATIPIILFCLLFGLSMDYEVFMLAKVTELYQSGLDDREATARGVAMTAPLVTGAALILVVIGIAFALTELVLVQQIGFGMAVALTLDATVVRVLLLPATMRLLGPANWWMPRALQRRVPRVEWAH